MNEIKYCKICGGVASDINSGIDVHSHISTKYCKKCKDMRDSNSKNQHCVYLFKHNDLGYIYIGLANGTLRQRIFSHLSGSNYDNIDSKYLSLIRDSEVLFCELDSFEETHLLESYLINKYKPMANKMYPSYNCKFDESKIKWIRFNDANKSIWYKTKISTEE